MIHYFKFDSYPEKTLRTIIHNFSYIIPLKYIKRYCVSIHEFRKYTTIRESIIENVHVFSLNSMLLIEEEKEDPRLIDIERIKKLQKSLIECAKKLKEDKAMLKELLLLRASTTEIEKHG